MVLDRLKNWLKREDVGASIRRFLINTLFDSTFILMGITVGSALVAKPELKVILGTMLTSSLALGISTGVSVYEAETLERERQVEKLEKSMLTDLEDTQIMKSIRARALFISFVCFLTPPFACILIILPFVLSALSFIMIRQAAWASIAVALGTIFFVGVYLGQNGKGNAILKGLTMGAFGAIAFVIGYWIETLI
ncbi:MAG: hypothetical protein OEZ25_00160 [Candidatus Bathyarchaeota archaeon]|nr:hypothetical protein [Candidatus Bathyarchaeota archaeon]